MSTSAIPLLMKEKPLFHGHAGVPTAWASQWRVLEFIDSSVGKDSRTLETGCGYSTVVFTATGASHTVVTPARQETERVAAFCTQHGIDTSKLTFGVGNSQEVLPRLVDAGPLDLVYVDGAHRFPYPCLDWHYTEERLKVGGFMLVDDVRIPTCRILHDFLLNEDNWSIEKYLGDTAVFRKTRAADYSREWAAQSSNSTYPDWSFLPFLRRPYSRSKWVRGVLRLARSVGLSRPT